MKKYIILVIPFVLNAQSAKSILNQIDNSPKIKSAKSLSKASYEIYLSTLAKKSLSVDLEYVASYSKEYPSIKMKLPQLPPVESRVGLKKHFSAELKISYPIFNGFAIQSQIEKAKFAYKESRLRVKDLKRNIYLKAVDSFSKLDALNAQISALVKAKKALNSGYKKANALFKSGLLGKSELYRIKAQLFGVKANIVNLNSQKKSLLSLLSYLTSKKIKHYSGTLHIKKVPRLKTLINIAIENRSDLLAIGAQIKQSRADIKLAKSQNYPHINAVGAIKREGDNAFVTKNDFSNIDKSYVGVQLKWNLYNGGQTTHQIEAAKYSKISKSLEYIDYKNLVKMQIKNSINELYSIRAMLKEARVELKAQKNYYDLSRAQFKNGLASADEFANSIASWANAKANYQGLLSKLTTQKAKIWLLTGLDSFKNSLK